MPRHDQTAYKFMQAKAKIMVVRDIERDDIEYISKTLNCLPIAHVDHIKPEKLGHADRVDEVQASQHHTHTVHAPADLAKIKHLLQLVATLHTFHQMTWRIHA